MTTRYNYCPYCNERIVFKIEKEDIDQSLYPAPVYILHKNKSCNKISTFYVDSLLRVSYKELGKKQSLTGCEIKIIETL
jgi:DNA-directed RNA polymerase subunit RPC12/RpoP